MGILVRRLVAICGAVGVVVVCVYAGWLGLAYYWAPEFQTEREWYEVQAQRLSKMPITPERVAAAKPWRRSGTSWTHHLSEREAVIPVGTDSGICVVWRSSHDNEWWGRVGWKMGLWKFRRRVGETEPVAGDAALAVDPEGNLYACRGHNCGSLQLLSDQEVTTVEGLFRSLNLNGGEPWEPYRGGGHS